MLNITPPVAGLVDAVSCRSLNGVHQSVIQQKETFYTECERLRQTATPRPDWERCADVVPGGNINIQHSSYLINCYDSDLC